ncbi:hypothetical protein LEP3755_35620 [Leptolyngbya sp. NIES-3755]|nr:hypothetical protein LEP3755_35620 [Leptolyngbya sp. NIES-3755]
MSQNSIEIYVKSSPLGSVGIHWRNINKDEQPVAEPIVLKERIITKGNGKKATINALINDVKPSIILARYSDKTGAIKTLLEVAGLEASEERSYQLGRRITEVLLWVGDDSSETEAHLRKLAACALLSFQKQDSPFLKTIRNAIRFEGLNEFRVDRVAIERLTAHPEAYMEVSLHSPSEQSDVSVWLTSGTIANTEHLHSLAQQISQTSLPDTDKPVVVVAEFKDECLEYRGNIWKAPTQAVEEIAPIPEEAEPEKKTLPVQPETKSFPTTRIIILGITTAIAALIIIVMSFQLNPIIEAAPNLIPTQQKITVPKAIPSPNSTP